MTFPDGKKISDNFGIINLSTETLTKLDLSVNQNIDSFRILLSQIGNCTKLKKLSLSSPDLPLASIASLLVNLRVNLEELFWTNLLPLTHGHFRVATFAWNFEMNRKCKILLEEIKKKFEERGEVAGSISLRKLHIENFTFPNYDEMETLFDTFPDLVEFGPARFLIDDRCFQFVLEYLKKFSDHPTERHFNFIGGQMVINRKFDASFLQQTLNEYFEYPLFAWDIIYADEETDDHPLPTKIMISKGKADVTILLTSN